MRYLLLKFVVLFITITFVYTASWGKENPKSRSMFLLGTVCTITLYDKRSNSVMDNAFDIVRKIDLKMDMDSKKSELNRINMTSGSSAVQVSADTYEVIKQGIVFTSFSKGRFDITVGPLVSLWGIATGGVSIPTQIEIDKALKLIGIENVVIQNSPREVFLRKSGMKLDLGGIAKGYAADAVVDYLKAQKVTRAIIDFGGNIFVHGSKGLNLPWRVGIQHPDKERGVYIGVVSVSNKAVVTSGKYERYIEIDKKRYHHILDTTTGYPVENRLSSVTVIADNSMTADAMSTAILASGLKTGLKMVEENEGLEAILLTDDNFIYLSSGIGGLFELSGNEYHLAD